MNNRISLEFWFKGKRYAVVKIIETEGEERAAMEAAFKELRVIADKLIPKKK